MEDTARTRRRVMKSEFAADPSPMSTADQTRGVDKPDVQKPAPSSSRLVTLPAVDPAQGPKADLADCIARRRSRRHFADTPLTLAELAWLLWATQGVRDLAGNPALRTVPSAGARHPFETYVAAARVDDLTPGVYRYLPLTHQLAAVAEVPDLPATLVRASCGQAWVETAAATLLWACVPYRSEWRYGRDAAKLCLLDAGHICQNLYLAAEAIGCGTCGIGAYDQQAVDTLLGLDGQDEFVVYYSPVGKAE